MTVIRSTSLDRGVTRYESGTRVPPDSIFWYISSLRSKMRNASSRLSSRST